MSRSLNPCREHRENICLLASGVLPEPERAEMENHLTTCTGCRKYHGEMRALVLPLADWERNFLTAEPTPATQARWATDFTAATAPRGSTFRAFLNWFCHWCRDMFWPSRRLWAGLTAVWIVVAVLDLALRGQASSSTQNSARIPPELVRAFLMREGLIVVEHPPGKTMPESLLPRSERRRPGSGV